MSVIALIRSGLPKDSPLCRLPLRAQVCLLILAGMLTLSFLFYLNLGF